MPNKRGRQNKNTLEEQHAKRLRRLYQRTLDEAAAIAGGAEQTEHFSERQLTVALRQAIADGYDHPLVWEVQQAIAAGRRRGVDYAPTAAAAGHSSCAINSDGAGSAPAAATSSSKGNRYDVNADKQEENNTTKQ